MWCNFVVFFLCCCFSHLHMTVNGIYFMIVVCCAHVFTIKRSTFATNIQFFTLLLILFFSLIQSVHKLCVQWAVFSLDFFCWFAVVSKHSRQNVILFNFSLASEYFRFTISNKGEPIDIICVYWLNTGPNQIVKVLKMKETRHFFRFLSFYIERKKT